MSNLSFKYFNITRLTTLILVSGTLIHILTEPILAYFFQNQLKITQFPTTGAIVIALLSTLNKYLYKIPFFWNLLMDVPYMGGNYIGFLSYSFKNPNGEEILEEKICEMKVRQDCSNVHFDCKFYFKNKENKEITESESYAEQIEINRLKPMIHFPYRQSGAIIGIDVPQALGFNSLEYDEEKKTIKGSYFTNRVGSQGGIIQVNKLD
jgi:hypothetical protein